MIRVEFRKQEQWATVRGRKLRIDKPSTSFRKPAVRPSKEADTSGPPTTRCEACGGFSEGHVDICQDEDCKSMRVQHGVRDKAGKKFTWKHYGHLESEPIEGPVMGKGK